MRNEVVLIFEHMVGRSGIQEGFLGWSLFLDTSTEGSTGDGGSVG